MLRDMGIDHVYDSRTHRVRRADPPRHRRLRRRHRAQLAAGCGAAGRPRTADLRRPVRRDRQARHLRRHQDGPVPVPAQPVLLRSRPRAADAGHPGHPAEPARGDLPADRRRRAAAAADHALPAGQRRHRDSRDGRRRAHRQAGARRARARVSTPRSCPPTGHRPSAPTARTSSPAVWAASGCSLPRRWPRPAAGASCSTAARTPKPEALRSHRAHPARPAPRWRSSSATSPKPATAARLVAAATATGMPLRGVLHAAAVIEDATLANITDDLHRPRLGTEGDGRVASSRGHGSGAAGLVLLVLLGGRDGGLAGTGRLRGGQQLAGLVRALAAGQGPARQVVAWGAWAQIGARPGDGRQRRHGDRLPRTGAYAFDALMRHTRVYSGYAPVAGAAWLTAFAQTQSVRRGVRSRWARTGRGRASSSTSCGLLPREDWSARVRRLISEEMSLILRRSVDADRPLSEYGLDSLGTLELRTRLESETGVRIGSTDVTTVRASGRTPQRD